MIYTLPNFLTEARVTIKLNRTGTSSAGSDIRMFIERIDVQQNWKRKYVYGHPKDWIQAMWLGGTLSFFGVYMNSSDIPDLIEIDHAERIDVGTQYQFISCRCLEYTHTVKPMGGGAVKLGGAISYSFDSYTAL
jgi:hypothetical protein